MVASLGKGAKVRAVSAVGAGRRAGRLRAGSGPTIVFPQCGHGPSNPAADGGTVSGVRQAGQWNLIVSIMRLGIQAKLSSVMWEGMATQIS